MFRYDEKYVSIPDVVQISADEYGDDIAILDGDVEWTFRDLHKRMLEVARGLAAIGIQPGDRVAVCSPNSARWVEAAIGIHAAGAILVPLNTRFKVPELSHILRKSGASAVLTIGEFLGTDYVELLRESAAGLPAADRIVTLDDRIAEDAMTFSDLLARGAAVNPSEIENRISALTGGEYSDVMFTSGTTGAPKGVKLTHSQSIRAYGHLTEIFGFRRGDVFAIVPPFFHTFGYKAGWLANLIHGVTTIPLRTFDPMQLMETIQNRRVTVLLGPPTLFVDIINHPARESYDLSSLRIGVPSAAKVPFSVYENMRNILGFDTVLSAYGLTEAGSFVTTAHPGDDLELISSTVGRAGEGAEIIVVNNDGEPAPPGAEGEILVRGYLVMDGYWEDPEATAAVMTSDGYLRTGDIGILDDRGYLKITDRLKDMFIVGGFNAYPAEIEELLVRFEKILHVAVIGVPDERMGEVGAAFVVPKSGTDVTPDEVISFAREHMANFKVPRHVFIVDDLPRNASMKVLKFELRDRAEAEIAARG